MILPKLAFLQKSASPDTGLSLTRDIIEKAIPGLRALEPLSFSTKFRSVAAPAVKIGGLRLAAAAHDPLFVQRADSPEGTFALSLPVHGNEEYTIRGKSLLTVAGHSAALLSTSARESRTELISNVLIALDVSELRSIASAMSGCPVDRLQLEMHDRILPLERNGIHLWPHFLNIFSSIDVLEDGDLMFRLGIGDSLYRIIAYLLMEDGVSAPEGSPKRYEDMGRLKLVCDYILANLDKKLSLATLEQVSGLSARVLQYFFLSKFNCTPTQWVREQRLLRARMILQSPQLIESITSVAMLVGFPSHSIFSKYYRVRFGESPSETSRRSRR